MEGGVETIGGAPPHHRERGEQQAGAQPSTENVASPRLMGTQTQPKTTPQAEMDARPVIGAANPSFVEDPPPYSPPDPKTLHLLYPTFQTSGPGQGPVFYQPAPLNHQIPGSYPFTIYNGSLFSEIPLEADRGQPPKDYTVESVLVTIFCCLLTGVIALVYSHEARAAWKRGDFVQAKAASSKAHLMVLVSLFFGVFASVSWVVYVVATLYL
ncbi:proline rich transmembrane protein 1B isoform X2 [Rhineura floridana]|nr:proline rich transmembrane protein 1B isoform X2 [Rhineura floridana]XP_061459856.1 proline rich transmembrane protein 1B isoform X2 [Rhineura floridana]XP_061459857.1 proline rich transmembrane protein 1B isoform X2 [Rhineura floridana]XP_061459858.1 proline rich transmembrane protein 1B isoform X2 [Rhineura floridana]